MKCHTVHHSVINPDFGVKKRKKLDPSKPFISQPLWNANYNGPSRPRDEDFNKPI
jgi:hypothetical protein